MAGVNPNGGVADFPAVQTHGGQFIQYNIFGNLFEVTAKYRPPIMPIGRGAYGIVWYRFILFSIFMDLDLLYFFENALGFLIPFLFVTIGFDCG